MRYSIEPRCEICHKLLLFMCCMDMEKKHRQKPGQKSEHLSIGKILLTPQKSYQLMSLRLPQKG